MVSKQVCPASPEPVTSPCPSSLSCCVVVCAEAYDTLSDANARGKYNAKLEQALKDDEDDYTGEVGRCLSSNSSRAKQ